MSILFSVVKNLLFFILFSTLVEQLLWDSSFKKYAELLLGSLGVLILLEPFFYWNGLEGLFYAVYQELMEEMG